MMDLTEIGRTVRGARKDKSWSQGELEAASGVSRSRIDHLENGRATDFGYNLIRRLFDALDLDMRLTTANSNRPTLEDLQAEGDVDAPRMG